MQQSKLLSPRRMVFAVKAVCYGVVVRCLQSQVVVVSSGLEASLPSSVVDATICSCYQCICGCVHYPLQSAGCCVLDFLSANNSRAAHALHGACRTQCGSVVGSWWWCGLGIPPNALMARATD